MAKKYLDSDGLLYFWQKIKNLFSQKSETVKTISRSGTTFTATRADGTTFTFDQQDNTADPATATPLAPGSAAVGTSVKYAREDHVHPLQTSVTGNAGTATTLETARTIDGVSFDGSANIIHYGVCSTAAATATKDVACTGFSLEVGAWIAVKFSVTNTAAIGSLQLNVNSTGAKPIKYRDGNVTTSSVLSAGRVYLFVYDGTNYNIVGDLDSNTTYTNASLGRGYGTCSNNASAVVKNVTLANYSLVLGGTVSVRFINGCSAIYALNINNRGAKPVVVNDGVVASESGEPLQIPIKGVASFIYDGTNYHYIGRDVQPAFNDAGGSPSMDGTANWGESYRYARADHVHPSDTSRVATSAVGAANGVCPLDANSKVDSSYLPSFVDDVIESYPVSGATELSAGWLSATSGGSALTPASGVIYILMTDTTNYSANTQFRWSGTTYVKLNDGGVSAITNAEIDTIVAS